MSRLMHIAAPGSADAGASFDTPLDLLTECHRRVEDQCALLTRLADHLKQHGSDAVAASAARAVLRYFELAAPKHHADEEDDLFPALLDSVAGSDAVCLRELIGALQADHRAFELEWLALREPLRAVEAGQPARLEASRVRNFAEHYAAHIAREEGELLPMAGRLLSDEVQARLGRHMRQRRGAPD